MLGSSARPTSFGVGSAVYARTSCALAHEALVDSVLLAPPLSTYVASNVDWGPRQRTPREFRGRTERGESGRVATYSSLGLPLELSLRLCVPASPRALCALTSPGVNILASGMLFSGQRVSELRCERQVAYVLRRLGGSERSTELARSTSTAVSLTTHPPRPGRMV